MKNKNPYPPDLSASARRHLEAADVLYEPIKRRDVAGYLYGISAECALKAMMLDAGMRPGDEGNRREDPFYAHFPQLKTLLRDGLLARGSGKVLKTYIENSKFMSQWDTDMRYSRGNAIRPEWVDQWREQARDIVSAIGT